MKADLTILLFRSSLFELSEDMTNGIYDFGAADRCGFASPEDMRRVFKKVEGRTIGKYIDS